MPKINVTIPHNLSAETAKSKIKNLFDELKNSFSDRITNLEENWNGNTGNYSFKAMGYDIKGLIIITDSEVNISGDLPFPAIFLKGKIESTIREKGEKLLN
jgi:hypothetical protein